MASREDVFAWILELHSETASFARVPRLVACRLGLVIEDADDAIQEAFQRCLRTPPIGVTTRHEFDQYCRRVAVNELKRRARREARCELFGDTTPDMLAPVTDPRTEAMLECFKQLSPLHCELLTEHYFHDATLEELQHRFFSAEKISISTVFRRVQEARVALKAELLARYPDHDWPDPTD